MILCVQPWETYRADLSIDLSKHHVPKTFLDKVAYRTVKLLRIPTDIFFKVRLFAPLFWQHVLYTKGFTYFWGTSLAKFLANGTVALLGM